MFQASQVSILTLQNSKEGFEFPQIHAVLFQQPVTDVVFPHIGAPHVMPVVPSLTDHAAAELVLPDRTTLAMGSQVLQALAGKAATALFFAHGLRGLYTAGFEFGRSESSEFTRA